MFKLEEQPYKLIEQIYAKFPPALAEKEALKLTKAIIRYPLKYYCPSGKQGEYIDMVANCTEHTKIPITLLTLANGAGKTLTTCHILCNFIYKPQNGWFDYPVFRNFPFPKLIWYCSTAEALADTIIPEFERLLIPETYKAYKHGKNYIDEIKVNGWTIKFKTYDQDPKTYQAATVGIIVPDEPMPEGLWGACKTRRRMGCVTLMPMTPLYCSPYILDEIKASSEKGLKGYYHIKGDVYTACRKRGIRGYLEPDIVDDMVKSYTIEERDACAFGEFMYFSGKIYSELDRTLHFVNPKNYPIPKGSRIVQIVDPHDSRPSMSGWLAITPIPQHCTEPRYIFFAESPLDQSRPFWDMKVNTTPEEEVTEWINIEKIFNIGMPYRVIDRIFGFQNRGGTCLAALFGKAGSKLGKPFIFYKSYQINTLEGEVEYGHNVVRQMLRPLGDGKPQMVFWNTCYHLYNGMNHYIKKRLTGKSAGDKASADGVIVDKYKDGSDVVRMGACVNITADVKKKKKRKYSNNPLHGL